MLTETQLSVFSSSESLAMATSLGNNNLTISKLLAQSLGNNIATTAAFTDCVAVASSISTVIIGI